MKIGRRTLAAVLAMLLLAACSDGDAPDAFPEPEGEPRETAARVFVMGIDGAGWPVLDAAVGAGVMPNLGRLLEAGSSGVLRSMDPTASAILWTTLATGKGPEQHGIRGFVARSESGKLVPVTSNMRRVKAIWKIASEAGVQVGFLGWWVSWPAERVRGFMATDYTWPLLKDGRGFATGVDPDLDLPGRTYPPGLIRELEPYNKIESRLDRRELEELGISVVPAVRGYAVRDMMLKDLSLGSMVGHLLGTYDPSLFAVYFDGFDAFCHIFWPVYKRYLDARSAGSRALEELPDGDRALAAALDRHLGRLDGYLGEVMKHAGEEDVVLVISDHGYGDNPGGKPILRGYGEWIRPPHWHTLDGIIAAAGGPIREGARLEDATVLDVTPTLLTLLGLPVARDMEGRALTGMMTDDFLSKHPLRWIESYESEEREEESPVESPYDEEVLERLRSLGYID